MILDSSALLAVVFQEPGFEALLEKIEAAPARAAGTPTLAETGIVLHARLGKAADGLLERLLDELDIQEIPFGSIHWREAIDAYRRFGKGAARGGAELRRLPHLRRGEADGRTAPLCRRGLHGDRYPRRVTDSPTPP